MNARSRSILFALWMAAIAANGALAETINMDMVTVGNPGNAADYTGYGAVGYEYRIGKYEVTIQQYTDFLNAAAKSDPYSLYNASMGTNLNIAGISRSGSIGAYTYSVIGPAGVTPAGASSPGNRPITYVSWWDAARFANWMHNGQLTGAAGAASTETGAYTLNGATSGPAVAKNLAAQFYIPSEDEWYKAAYYKGGSAIAGYWDYATQSDTEPGNAIGRGANQANFKTSLWTVTQQSHYSTAQNYLADVGAFANSASFYGTFDQNGSVYEWGGATGAPGSLPSLRGGSWQYGGTDLRSDYRLTNDASLETIDVGFRLAAVAVPEPSAWVMGLAGVACAALAARRRQAA
jgi:sulfatase modifying factor 1